MSRRTSKKTQEHKKYRNTKQYLATLKKKNQKYSRIKYCPFLQIKANRKESRVDSNRNQRGMRLIARKPEKIHLTSKLEGCSANNVYTYTRCRLIDSILQGLN